MQSSSASTRATLTFEGGSPVRSALSLAVIGTTSAFAGYVVGAFFAAR